MRFLITERACFARPNYIHSWSFCHHQKRSLRSPILHSLASLVNFSPKTKRLTSLAKIHSLASLVKFSFTGWTSHLSPMVIPTLPRWKLDFRSKASFILRHLKFWAHFALKLEWCAKEICWKELFQFPSITMLPTFIFNAMIMKFDFNVFVIQNYDLKWPHQIFHKNLYFEYCFRSM